MGLRLLRRLLGVWGCVGFTVTAFAAGPAPALPTLAAQPSPGNLAAETGDKEGRIRVQIAPRNEVVLSAELAASIASFSLREGDAFRAGSTLVEFDCSPFNAQLAKAQALLEAAQQTLVVNQRLAELNAIGALEVQQTQAKVKEYTAEVDFIRFSVGRCLLKAPFAGRVGKRMVAAHQYVTPGTPLLSILDTSVMEVQMIVPSRWLAWLKVGQRFSVQVDELGGKTASAKVVRVGARIDAVSQSVALVGVIDATPAGLLSGMSGWAQFAPPR